VCPRVTDPSFPGVPDFVSIGAAASQAINARPGTEVCAVCDIIIRLKEADAEVCTLEHHGQEPSSVLQDCLTPPSGLPEAILMHYKHSDTAADVHPDFKKLLLSPHPNAIRGSTQPDGVSAFNVCKPCFSALENKNQPKYAIAAGFWMGSATNIIANTAELNGLTRQEWNLLRLSVSRREIRTYDPRSIRDVHNNIVRPGGLGGHALFSTGDPNTVGKYLDKLPNTTNATLTVHITGPTTSPQRALLAQQCVVRKTEFIAALNWLQHWNVLYEQVQVDDIAVAGLPEGAPLPGTVLDASKEPEGIDAPSPDIHQGLCTGRAQQCLLHCVCVCVC
jgi:hypothetical protein